MKRIYTITTIIMAALAIAGCAKELEENNQVLKEDPKEEPKDDPKVEDGTMVLGAMLPDYPDASDYDAAVQSADTKTTISDNGDKTYSVHWAEGDAISVNGKTSKNINISPDNPKSATFTLDVVDAPYCAVYPAGATSDYATDTSASGNEGEEGYAATVPAQVTVTVPSVQKYVANGIDPDAAIMYAYSASATEPLQFKHAMAYLKLTVDGAAVKSVRVNGNHNEMMSGDFILSYNTTENVFVAKPESGTNKPKGNVSVKYLCGDAAIPAGTPMFIAIPATLYENGLTLTVIDDQDHYQVIKSLTPFTATSGKVYPTEISFSPTGTYIEGGIYTVEDWNAFVAAVNSGDWSAWKKTINGEEGVHLMADIYSSTNLPRTNDKKADGTMLEWDGIFYGNNHVISHDAVEPLFLHIGSTGKVQDLTVSGTRKKNVNNGWPGAIALNNAGEINNCTNQANVEISGTSTNAAGICRTNRGKLINCKNVGNITVSNPSTSVTDIKIGGIALYSSGTITGCSNEGMIDVSGVSQNCVVAGVVLDASGTVEKLENKGDISIDVSLKQLRTIYLGGVIANAETSETLSPEYNGTKVTLLEAGNAKMIQSCSNSGNLKIKKSGAFHMKGGAIGGIAASVNTGSSTSDCTFFDDCTNKGNISFYENETYLNDKKIPLGAYAVGGILGRCSVLGDNYYYKMDKGCYTVIRLNCSNTGTLDVCVADGQPMGNVNSGARQVYVGGIAGFVGGGSVRGKNTKKFTIKLGSSNGGICAGGILGGSYNTGVIDASAEVEFVPSVNDVLEPTKIGYVGAALGWSASSVKIERTAVKASFNFNDALKDKANNYSEGFAGVKTGATLTVAADCTYQGVKVETTDIYGGGIKKIN